MDEMEIQAIMESGDPDAMDALIDRLENSPDDDLDAQEPEPELAAATATAEPEAESTPSPVADESAPPDPVVMSKNGKHEIPFAVVQELRQKQADLQQQLQAKDEQLARYQSVVESNDLQLPMDPSQLTEEQMQTLSEDYGDIGQLVVAQAQQVKQLKADVVAHKQVVAQSTQQQVAAEVEAALASNADLVNWRSQDPERFEFAQQVDDRLKLDPIFSKASLEQRFAEVAKRTRAAYGDATMPAMQDKAQQIIDQAAQKPPSSIGSLPGVQGKAEDSLLESFENLSPEAMEEKVNSMSEQQLEALFGSLG